MTVLTQPAAIEAFCTRAQAEPWIAIDTEFLREHTYFAKLCLVQIATKEEAVAIDPLELDDAALAPLKALLLNEAVLKVFHAGRQDLEIFYYMLGGQLPRPVFDTQIAAMAVGFPDSVGYETLVRELVGAKLDKGGRMTDWTKRPLTPVQIAYALDDVIHLRTAYQRIHNKLKRLKRLDWPNDLMGELLDPSHYDSRPELAWGRFKLRHETPQNLQVLKAVATWREQEAQRRDVPRGRILKDDQLLEVVAAAPASVGALERVRMLPQGFARGKWGHAVAQAVADALAADPATWPQPSERRGFRPAPPAVIDLLKVLLKLKAEEHGVAPRLLASSAEVERLAADDHADVPAASGWRFELYGAEALGMKRGRIALALRGGRLVTVPTGELTSGVEPKPQAGAASTLEAPAPASPTPETPVSTAAPAAPASLLDLAPTGDEPTEAAPEPRPRRRRGGQGRQRPESESHPTSEAVPTAPEPSLLDLAAAPPPDFQPAESQPAPAPTPALPGLTDAPAETPAKKPRQRRGRAETAAAEAAESAPTDLFGPPKS